MAEIPTRRDNQTFLIGLFVIVGVLGMAATIIYVGAVDFFEKPSLYATYFDASVEGLEPGNPVKYQGVPIGTIQEVRVAPDGVLVEVIMQIEPGAEIRSSMRVRAEYLGITGKKYLEGFFPDAEEQDLIDAHPSLSFKPEYPVVPSAPGGLKQLGLALTEAVNNVNKIDTKGISDALTAFLEEGRRLAANDTLRAVLAKLDRNLGQVSRFMRRLDSTRVIENVQRIGDNLAYSSELVVDAVDTLGKQVSSLELDRRVERINARFDSLMTLSNRTVSMAGHRAESISFQVAEIVAELHATSRELRRTLQMLNDNPSQMLLSEPPPTED